MSKRKSDEPYDGNNKRSKLEDDHPEYRCPITKQIYADPVMASDGHIYEKEAIQQWLAYNSISPMTKEELDKKILIPVHAIKMLVDRLLKGVPELQNDRYEINTAYEFNRDFIIERMEKKYFYKLLEYNDFLLTDWIGCGYFIKFLAAECEDDRIIKHVLDNCVDKNVELGDDNYTPLFYIVRYCSNSVIHHALDNGFVYEDHGKLLEAYCFPAIETIEAELFILFFNNSNLRDKPGNFVDLIGKFKIKEYIDDYDQVLDYLKKMMEKNTNPHILRKYLVNTSIPQEEIVELLIAYTDFALEKNRGVLDCLLSICDDVPVRTVRLLLNHTDLNQEENKMLLSNYLNQKNLDSEIISLLVDHTDFSVDENNLSLLKYLFYSNKIERAIIRKFIDRMQHIDILDNYSFVHCMVRYGDVSDVVYLLDRHTVNMEIQTELSQYTPLHVAIIHSSHEMVDYLLKLGVNPNAEFSRGFAIHLACERGDIAILNTLLSYKVNPEAIATDRNGIQLTPLDILINGATEEMINLLLDSIDTHDPDVDYGFIERKLFNQERFSLDTKRRILQKIYKKIL